MIYIPNRSAIKPRLVADIGGAGRGLLPDGLTG
jgi:hypothetical protein